MTSMMRTHRYVEAFGLQGLDGRLELFHRPFVEVVDRLLGVPQPDPRRNVVVEHLLAQVEVRLQAFAAEVQPVPVAKRRQARLLLVPSGGGGEFRTGLASVVAQFDIAAL